MKALFDNRLEIVAKALIAFCLTSAFAFGASVADKTLDRGLTAYDRGDPQRIDQTIYGSD
ncbi:MAG: hypothetical protein LBP89_08465 [Helicobacteraceae bacterium]|jgi:hypothetical protein|nr:hypothetical protein [Helicobacteraceae bacterium]